MRIKNNRLVDDSGKMVTWAESPNVGGQLANGGKPTTLVIHYTAGGPASQTVKYFGKSSSKVSAHLVIGRDGTTTQMVKFDRVGWHAGTSRWKGKNGANSYSLGFELANYGKLKKTASGGWKSWSGQTVPADRVILDEHKHFPGKEYGWEMFDEAQMTATVEAAKAVVEEYGLKPWDVVGHEDISIHRKIDPGPAFEMDRFRSLVFGRGEDTWNDDIFAVDSPTGLNMRIEPQVSAKKIENLPDGTKVLLIERINNWWLVAKLVDNDEDVTGYVHRKWLQPV